jgi:hypothetical protein
MWIINLITNCDKHKTIVSPTPPSGDIIMEGVAELQFANM